MKTANLALAGALLLAAGLPATAKQGAPHSLKARTGFGSVSLEWNSPEAAKQLKWHDGSAYNGDDGLVNDPVNSTVSFFAGARFDAADLKNNVGDVITAVTFYQYRPVISATVMVFENGTEVARATADPALFKKDTMLDVDLPQSITIKEGAEYLFAVNFVAGNNMDMVAIKDRATAAPGKSDLLSYNGKDWFATGAGDYLVTAQLANDVDEAPAAFALLIDGEPAQSPAAPESGATLSLTGKHTLAVRADYDGQSFVSKSIDVDVPDAANTLADANWDKITVTDLDVALAWNAPLDGGAPQLTWGSDTQALNIGGTASSNTKVWIRNQFDATDLLAFAGAKVQSVKMYFAEAVTSVTVWMQKDGVFTDYKAYTDPINEAGWYDFAFETPVELEAGHAYAYGLYVLHAPKGHPIAVSDAATIDVKGNCFSTGSPNSTNFLKSNPTWKTLRSGAMEGNWMMKAVLDRTPGAAGPFTYDLYRDGMPVAQGLTATSADDAVADLGTYKYTVVARDAAGRSSLGASKDVTVSLPSAYAAPVITGSDYDDDTRTVSLAWTTDKQLSKAGEPAYMVGFDEDMDLMWGAQFSAAELAAYQGYSVHKLMVGVADDAGDLTVGVFTKTGTPLSQVTLPQGSYQPMALYTVSLPVPVALDGSRDLIFAYKANVKGGNEPILTDAGPLAEGGARISVTGGASWLNLGTLNPNYAGLNIFIKALATTSPGKAPAKTKALEGTLDGLTGLCAGVIALDEEISATGNTAAAKAAAQAPVVKEFNVYRNGQLIAVTRDCEYSGQLPAHGVFNYYVKAVFTNGWTSPASSTFTASRHIDQKATAPYALTAERNGNHLSLTWQHPGDAVQLTYVANDSYGGLGMTGTNPTSHVAAKFTAEALTDHVGKKIDHIQFALYDAGVTSLSVIVLYGENIVYRQAVPVSSLVAGINDVRLSQPVQIPAGTDVCIGYVTKYPTGLKPLGLTTTPADPLLGDLISSSAAAGYWYSLKNKFKVDNNFWLKAILAHDDHTALSTLGGNATTYNVYCDGRQIASGLSANSHLVTDAPAGVYHVTAVDAAGNESGESNRVYYGTNAADDITADDAVAPGKSWQLNGMPADNAAPGTIVIRRQGNTVTKQVVR